MTSPLTTSFATSTMQTPTTRCKPGFEKNKNLAVTFI